MNSTPIYLDYNATAPLDPLVKDEMLAFLGTSPGNASSLHAYGQRARLAIARARGHVARMINAHADEIIFTSGGTESNNLAILGAVPSSGAAQGQILTTGIEHQSVLNPCRHMEDLGHAVSFLPASPSGTIDPGRLAAAWQSPVRLVSVMLANNDTGALQPVAEAARVAHEQDALFHTDAVQAVGKVPVDVNELGVDLLSFSAHKLHGPSGVGALYVRRGLRLSPLLFGGHQERGFRPGTENAVAIVGFGKACELAALRLTEEAQYLGELRRLFERALAERLPEVGINAQGAPRLPNTSNVRFGALNGDALVMNLDLLGVAASGGSACSASDPTPSHVLLAMGQTRDQARSAVRFSIGRETTAEEIDQAVRRITGAVEQLRKGARAPQ